MNNLPEIDGIDSKKVISDLDGNVDVYIEMLGGYRRDIPDKINLIREKVQLPDLKEFVILVHGIKSASRMLGINDLGEEMYRLELAGKELNREYIFGNLERVLEVYSSFYDTLEPYDSRNRTAGSKEFSEDGVKEILLKLKAALEDFESETAEELVKALGEYSFSKEQQEVFEKLQNAIDNFDYFESIECVNKFMEVI